MFFSGKSFLSPAFQEPLNKMIGKKLSNIETTLACTQGDNLLQNSFKIEAFPVFPASFLLSGVF